MKKLDMKHAPSLALHIRVSVEFLDAIRDGILRIIFVVYVSIRPYNSSKNAEFCELSFPLKTVCKGLTPSWLSGVGMLVSQT